MNKEILLGDEAAALGAVHAGLGAGYSYPGTPASEIMEYLVRISGGGTKFTACWSVNEKTAFEEALGASFAAPFLADPHAVQQGYVSSEPYLIQQVGRFEPVVLPISDAGYKGYGNIISTSRKLVDQRPDLVQRFIDASIEGWRSYLTGDPAPADALIRQANTAMPQDLIDFGRATMIRRGTVLSGDALSLGIGAMTLQRWQEFYADMASVGVYPTGIDIAPAIETRFVNKGLGRP